MYGARAPPARRPVGWFSYTFLKFQDIDFNRPLPKKRQLLLQLPFLWGPAARRAATPFGILMLRAAKPPLRQDFRLWRKCLYGAKTPPANRPVQRTLRWGFGRKPGGISLYTIAILQISGRRKLNCTPFVRQYVILNNKWGALLCQKEYRTRDILQNSKKLL